jgi:pyruvate formate lyase activating enzyme
MHAKPRREFYSKMDAANVDLKGFTEEFYFRQTGAHLAPVLETLEYIVHETQCWLEITTLLIPGHNDDAGEIEALSRWVHEHLGPDVPLHFTAFHPDFRMRDVPPTPPATLKRAREIARAQGLRYVYTGNVHDTAGGTTCCPGCHAALIVRDWYELPNYALKADGTCPRCGTRIAGRWRPQAGGFGRKRIPVRRSAAA